MPPSLKMSKHVDPVPDISMPYEYLLKTWGQYTGSVEAKTAGHSRAYYWFSAMADRERFLLELMSAANDCGKTLVIDKQEGRRVRFKTVADLTLTTPDGRDHSGPYSFGYGYPADAASFFLTDGNFACDCRRTEWLVSRGITEYADPSGKEAPCANTIVLKNLMITNVLRLIDMEGAYILNGKEAWNAPVPA